MPYHGGMTPLVLIVDDDPDIRALLARTLERIGYESEVVGRGDEALDRVREGGVDILLTDVNMPGVSGIDLLRVLSEEGIRLPTLVMSGAATIDDALDAVRLGAIDFIEKPVTRARLKVSLARGLELTRLREETTARRGVSDESVIRGSSEAVRSLRAMIRKVARTEGRVLITGENGTGKELVASAIHAGSHRVDHPFVKLNCSAIPRDLVESELFGHERGAFTGAHQARRGRFELAHKGTLLLDEIGDMPIEMQTKLLRVLEEGRLERVGGSRAIDVDVRVVAATHRDLPAMVEAGTFREDLFYRLDVVRVNVPPLRARLEDVPDLAAFFCRRSAEENRRPVRGFTPEALKAFSAYDYPGNVRELRNLVERLVILAEDEIIDAPAVRAVLGGRRGSAGSLYRKGRSLGAHLEALEKQILEEAIRAEGSRAAAARALDVERSFFYKKCKRLDIDGD